MSRAHCTVVLSMIALLVVSTGSASAGEARADLNGTWTGTIKCKSFKAGAKSKFTLTPTTMQITQGGLEVGIRLDLGTTVLLYSATMNPDAKKPLEKGELAIVFCGTNDQVGDDPTFDEIGRMAVKAKRGDVKGSFKGSSLFSKPGVLAAEAGTCKWSFKRTVSDFPIVPTGCLTGLKKPRLFH